MPTTGTTPEPPPATDHPIAEAPPNRDRVAAKRVWLIILVCAATVAALLVRTRVLPGMKVSAALDRGAKLVSDNRPNEAEQAWKEAEQLDPGNPNAVRALALLYRAQGKAQEAHDAFNRLVDKRPNEPHILCELADDESRLTSANLISLAEADATRAVKMEPGCARAFEVAARLAARKGDQKQAIVYLQSAHQLKPADVPLSLHLVNTYLESNDPRGALNVATEITKRYPGYAHGYAMVGFAASALSRGSPEEVHAQEALHTALKLDPANGLAHAKLGQLLLSANKTNEAISHLESALLLHNESSKLLFQMANAYQSLGKAGKASRAKRDYSRISSLENDITSLNKRMATSPGDTALRKQLAGKQASLGTAHDLYEQWRRDLHRESAQAISPGNASIPH